MSAAGDLAQMDLDFIQKSFLEDFRYPKGLHGELIDGEIFITGVPARCHEHCLSEIVTQIVRGSAGTFQPVFRAGLRVPGIEGFPENHVTPDAMLAAAERRAFHGDDPWMSPDGLSMVVEVTDAQPERDREAKRYGYARAGIPLYLLVDRQEKKVTLFSGPEEDDYRRAERVRFGKTILLPAPFEVEVDTSSLL
ncbi:Uma2 family endonuclease [Actinomadura sp. 3N508]|uniref:Uma2 family endonuclease n=1 Tax=Actinomadura sp. 3N508 TaxID=3375153 RepID=UPI0037B0052A